MDDLELLLNIGNIILDTETYDKALQSIVSHLNQFLESDVCSIYLYNQNRELLILMATQGLHQDAIGKVNMKPSEGLTGQVFTGGNYLFIKDASHHPKHKYFPGIGEEPFNTFIGIPLKDKKSSHGVLVFQFLENKENTPMLEKLLITVASIVSGMVLKFNIAEIYEESEQIQQSKDLVFNGMPLSNGIAIGTPVHMIYHYIESCQRKFDPKIEIEKLEKAFDQTRAELGRLIKQIESSDEHISIDIFQGHLLMLQDPSYKKEMLHHIAKYNKGAAFSIRYVSNKYIRKFKSIPDGYLRERASDIDDICLRLLSNLGALHKTAELEPNSIIISDRLTPGETASLDLEKVSGFVTQKDGPSSHTAILARNRQIPAVSGIEYLLKLTEFANTMIIDGFKGKVIINPSQTTIDEYRLKQIALKRQKSDIKREDIDDSLIKENGITLFSNVSSILDAAKSAALNADGIGLVRTEIFYLQKKGDFDYQTQLELYGEILNSFPEKPIIFRLLDLGADKRLRSDIAEDNPALGLRGVRLLLKETDLFKEQVKALLEVSKNGRIKLMVPFITETWEFVEVKNIITSVAKEKGCDPPPIGAMIEIPSAVFILEELIDKADFFSIGTNDLFQYFCAVDRNNSHVSYRYNPDTQSFISLLDLIFQKTKHSGKEVEICGEIAADPTILSILLHIGYRHFSINPYSLRNVRNYLAERFEIANSST
jgi:phosphotransferase system enzyme I (PtsP)